ncbi:DUF4917 family protein [Aeromonas caviae]|uniref:DUF4917 family protein n=1 Tax=Aeromonas caviae TaxID=648 RepID=UPI002B49E89D|nr:DUF4917 family protein [Aeromonas caviae]
MGLSEWRELQADYSDTLIVGNGGSVAVDPCFRYASLYQHGCAHDFISAAAQQVFDQCAKNSRDFERVLYRLWQADYINQKFELAKIERDKVRKAYTDVRRALIDTVKAIHPDKAICNEQGLAHIGRFMASFSTVFSLNYDLIIYWASLNASQANGWRFEDGFTIDKTRSPSTKLIKQCFNESFSAEPKPGMTKVFYPHGNLALYQTKKGEESKLAASHHDPLSLFTQYWRDNNGQPLFVCEGSAAEKVATINSSRYLRHVYQHELPRPKHSMTIYGWSIGKQDYHILEQLALSQCRRAAVSVFTGNKTPKQIEFESAHMEKMLNDAGIERVEFFDAASAGCWNHAD